MMIGRFLEFFARRGAVLLAISIFVGLFVPPLARAMRFIVTPTVVGLMTLVLLRVDFAAVFAYLRRPALVLWLLAWLMLGAPLVAFGGVWLTEQAGLSGPSSGTLGAAFVIVATGCATTSAPAFARLVGLDAQLSLVGSVLSTLIVPFTAPPLALGLLGIALPITVAGLSLRLLLVVGLPLVVSLAVRRVFGEQRLAPHAGAIDGAAVLLVVLYGVGVMDGILAAAIARPGFVALATALGFLCNYGLNALTALVFAPFGRRIALASGLMSGNRNMALYLAVMPSDSEPDLLLFFALCQFPLFLSPFLLAPVYRRLVTPQPSRSATPPSA
jgi:BASS family bile acid:Na+ symporter